MALHKDFPPSPYAILDPDIWTVAQAGIAVVSLVVLYFKP